MNRVKSRKSKDGIQNGQHAPTDNEIPTTSSRLSTIRVVALSALAFIIFAVYAHSGGFDFLYDDHKLIVRQGRAESLEDFTRVFKERHWDTLPYYRPVSRLTFVVQKWMHGDEAGPFHLFNTFLISLCALLASRLLCQPQFRIPFALAVIGGAIFALHPAASSVVYPICSGRETLIPAVFIIACTTLWIRGTTLSHVGSLLLLPLALLSKEQAIIIPALFFVADILRVSVNAPKRDITAFTNWLIRYAPIGLIVAAYFGVRRILFEGTGQHSINLFDHPELPLLSLLYAIQTLFLPFIELNYEPQTSVWLVTWRACLAIIATALLVWAVVRFLKRNGQPGEIATQAGLRQASASKIEIVMFWLCWICFALAPTANILKQEASFAERYVFLAILGGIGIIGGMLEPIWTDKKRRSQILVVSGIIAIACGAISFHRGAYFRNDDAFLNQWIKSDPQSCQALSALAEYYVLSNRNDDAWKQLNKAIKIDPFSAPSNNIIGYILYNEGKPEEALPYLETALASLPEYAEAHNNYAVALSMLRRFDQAIEHYEKAIRINPNYAEPYSNQGLMYKEMGKYDLAISCFQTAISINNSTFQAHFGLGNIALEENRFDDARLHYQVALQLAPRNPSVYVNMGNTYLFEKNVAEAEPFFRQALKIDANNVIARRTLDRMSKSN